MSNHSIKNLIKEASGLLQEQEGSAATLPAPETFEGDPNKAAVYDEIPESPVHDVMDFAMALAENYPDIPRLMDPCALAEYFETKCEELGGDEEEDEEEESGETPETTVPEPREPGGRPSRIPGTMPSGGE